MAQIGKTIPEFKAQAFHNSEFVEVTSESVLKASGQYFCSTLQILLLFVLQN